MILYDLTGSEEHPVYQDLAVSNGERHYEFLQSIVNASLAIERPFLSQTIIKAINYHAIACLHTHAGEYRPCAVSVGPYQPADHYRVSDLMDDFVNVVNRCWEPTDPIELAAYTLWRLNHIHPFINGNGRTARASCYFVLCIKAGVWLGGDVLLPELIRQHRAEYVEALREADKISNAADLRELNLEPLKELIRGLLVESMGAAQNTGGAK